MGSFCGGYPATIDVKGRVKLPERLRRILEGRFGREVYVCSFRADEIRIIPFQVWQRYEQQLASQPDTPAVQRHKDRLSLGQVLSTDDSGRIVLPALLREAFDMEGDVMVAGRTNYLAVTTKARAKAILKDQSPSDEEQHELAKLEL